MPARRRIYADLDADPPTVADAIAEWFEERGYDGDIEEIEDGQAVWAEKGGLFRGLAGGIRRFEVQVYGDPSEFAVESRVRGLPMNLASVTGLCAFLTTIGVFAGAFWIGLLPLPFHAAFALWGFRTQSALWRYLREVLLGEGEDEALEAPGAPPGRPGRRRPPAEEEMDVEFGDEEPEIEYPEETGEEEGQEARTPPPPRRRPKPVKHRYTSPDPDAYTAKYPGPEPPPEPPSAPSPGGAAGQASAANGLQRIQAMKMALEARRRAGTLSETEYLRQAKDLGKKRLALQGIERLEGMRDAGEIDAAEFERRKAELLRRVAGLDLPG